MTNKRFLPILFVVLGVLGCQNAQEIAQPDAVWTTYDSPNHALRFALPEGMKKSVRSREPAAFGFETANGDFSIAVLHGTFGQAGDGYADSMIETALEGNKKLGDTQQVKLGAAEGLQQDHRSLFQYKHYVGRTIVLTSGDERLLFEVSYAERYEEDLKPVFERVIDSLRFEHQPSTTTRNVSLQSAE